MPAVDVKQVVPQDVNKSPCSVVGPGCTCVGRGNKQKRDRQASAFISRENSLDLGTKCVI